MTKRLERKQTEAARKQRQQARRRASEEAEFRALQRAMARLTPEEQRLFVESWDKAGQPADESGPTPAHAAAIKRLGELVAEEKARGLH